MLRVAFSFTFFILSMILPSLSNGETQPYSDEPTIRLEVSLPSWISREDFNRIIKEVSAQNREFLQTHTPSTSGSVVELNLVQKRNFKSSLRLQDSFTNTIYDLTESVSEYRSGSMSDSDLKEEAVSETIEGVTTYAITRELDKRALSLSKRTRKTLGKILGTIVTSSADILRERRESNGLTSNSDGSIENSWNENFDRLRFTLRIPF